VSPQRRISLWLGCSLFRGISGSVTADTESSASQNRYPLSPTATAAGSADEPQTYHGAHESLYFETAREHVRRTHNSRLDAVWVKLAAGE
jgi:hypothetical protein